MACSTLHQEDGIQHTDHKSREADTNLSDGLELFDINNLAMTEPATVLHLLLRMSMVLWLTTCRRFTSVPHASPAVMALLWNQNEQLPYITGTSFSSAQSNKEQQGGRSLISLDLPKVSFLKKKKNWEKITSIPASHDFCIFLTALIWHLSSWHHFKVMSKDSFNNIPVTCKALKATSLQRFSGVETTEIAPTSELLGNRKQETVTCRKLSHLKHHWNTWLDL